MREIKKLSEDHIDAYTDIAYNAYPSFKDFSPEPMKAYKNNLADIMRKDKDVTFYGMFEDGELIAVMRLFDFKMNLFGKIIDVSGLGFLGVHLMHKKKKAAREMVEFYEKVYRDKNVPFASLLPFRPDFYKKMGYGAGTKMDVYRLETGRIPAYWGESDIRYVGKDSYPQLLECHGRVVGKTHGMIMKISDEIRNLYDEDFDRIVASYGEDGEINGYMAFRFQNAKPGNYTANNINVKEMIYETPEVLKKLLGFLRKQEDQVQLVIFKTEDEYFYYLFDNPLNDSRNYTPFGYIESNTQSVGMMYKVLDLRQAFLQCAHRYYNNASVCARFVVEGAAAGRAGDDKNHEEITVDILNGKLSLDTGKKPDITVTINISEFSAMFFGSASVGGLHRLGLLTADNECFIDELDRAFYCAQKPVCYTDF